MTDLKRLEVWFVTGSQHLYGAETLKQVSDHAQQIATSLNKAKQIPVQILFKPIVTTTDLQGRLTEGTYRTNGNTDNITSGTIGIGLNWY